MLGRTLTTTLLLGTLSISIARSLRPNEDTDPNLDGPSSPPAQTFIERPRPSFYGRPALDEEPAPVADENPDAAWAADVLENIDLAASHVTVEEWIARGAWANHPALHTGSPYVSTHYGLTTAPKESIDLPNAQHPPNAQINAVNDRLAEHREALREMYDEGRHEEAGRLRRTILEEAGLGAPRAEDHSTLEERVEALRSLVAVSHTVH